MSKLNNSIRLATYAVAFAVLALPHAALSQGRGNDKGKEQKKVEKAEDKRVDKLQKAEVKRVEKIQKADAKRAKHVTTLQGVTVTRQVLVANGYQVVNVVPSGTSQIVYYRRGNMGKGRGLGPVQKIIIVPAGQVVQFQSVPQSLLSTILARLGM